MFHGPSKSGPDRDRTDDLHTASVALSQLSYGPVFEWCSMLSEHHRDAGVGQRARKIDPSFTNVKVAFGRQSRDFWLLPADRF